MLTSGEGKYKVWLKQEKIGDNLLFVLGGGEKYHIGGVVICEPDKKAQAIRLEGHFDDIVLKKNLFMEEKEGEEEILEEVEEDEKDEKVNKN